MGSSTLKIIGLFLLCLLFAGVALVLGLTASLLLLLALTEKARLASGFDLFVLISSELVGAALAAVAAVGCFYKAIKLFYLDRLPK